MLAGALLEVMDNTAARQLRRRLIPPILDGDPYWIFLVLPKPADKDYASYRASRQRFLIAHCFVVKYLYPTAVDIVALAVEPPHPQMSEDIVYFDAREWTPEENERARRLHEDAKIFVKRVESRRGISEFPVDELAPPTDRKHSRTREREAKLRKKRQRRERERQRRKNR
jgi:hypothetical protein